MCLVTVSLVFVVTVQVGSTDYLLGMLVRLVLTVGGFEILMTWSTGLVVKS